MAEQPELLQVQSQWADRRWRLSNLYNIIDKDGHKVQFRPNWAQQALLDDLHSQNLILKARQLGFTTFIQIFMLDACLFNSNIRAGTIAHRLDDAKVIFRDKIRFPYDNLPDQLKAAQPIKKDAADELLFENNSSIRVGVSMRSGTLQYLHISEYGQVCARFPEKAREIRTGALNTVQAGQVVWIESTAEGKEGHYFDLCEAAQSKQRTAAPLSSLDFKFFFFPWWKAPEYQIDPASVLIDEGHRKYFAGLETAHGITLTPAQQAWYVKKAETQLGDMKREYPSTAQEAFEASVEGAYYGELLAQAELQGRIGEYPADPDLPVHTAWDIGRSDYTSIWFFQRQVKRLRVVGFFQNSGEGMPYYADELFKLYEANKWKRKGAVDYVPHDARVTEWGSNRSRIEQMVAKRLSPVIPTELSLADGINATRAIIPVSTFDAGPCSEGIKVLRGYRKEWDEEHGCWKDKPRHDWASHGSDAFRILACAYRDVMPPPTPEQEAEKRKKAEPRWAGVGGDMTVDDLIRIHGLHIQGDRLRV
jgi:hypothetical protein